MDLSIAAPKAGHRSFPMDRRIVTANRIRLSEGPIHDPNFWLQPKEYGFVRRFIEVAVNKGRRAMQVFFALTVLICLVAPGCAQPSNQPSTTTKEAVRTDAAPIAKRLPKLGPLQSVWWTSTQVTLNSRLSPPGNPAYKVSGFAQLEKEKANELAQQFQWERMPPEWKPAMTMTNLDSHSAEWSQSSAFTKDCKP